MAYGYNDGDQRPQSVRLAGRTTPTPRSTSDNDSLQRPQEQPGASSRQQSRTVQQSDRMSTSTRQRQTNTSQPRRYDRRKTDYYVKRSFSRPQRDRGNSAPHPASHITSHALPARRLRLAFCSIAACLVFVFLGSCISHGSAGLEPTAEDKLMMDLMYIESFSIWLDIKLLFRTFTVFFKSDSTEGFAEADQSSDHSNAPGV